MSRVVPQSITDGWSSPAKIGEQRPVVRATIQHQNFKRFEYDTAWANGGTFETDRHRTGRFATMIFGDMSPPKEIRNLQSCSWERSVDQDVATCTITLLNSELTAIGEPRDNPTSPDEFDKPGYYTYSRGDQRMSANRWGYDSDTGWNHVFVPDRVVKTYEGYGVDRTVSPADDAHLVQSGTWIIDKVTYSAEGTITLEMRDLGRLLLDHITFPPIIPMDDYPLTWSKIRSANISSRDAKGGSWVPLVPSMGEASSSNDHYVGKGLTNPPYAVYVTNNGGTDGHHASHVLIHGKEGENASDFYWLSTGQESRGSTVWWQVDLNENTPVAALRLHMWGGPYRAYISIHNGTKWIGKREIPYKVTTGDVNVKAGVRFVKSVIADRGEPFDVILPRAYNAQKIRITFSRLRDTGVGLYPWRASMRKVEVYTAPTKGELSFGKGQKLKVVGNYSDYTHIVKWVCAWGGFWWPPHNTDMDFYRVNTNDGPEKRWVTYGRADTALPKGRVWGDFMKTGTAGEADLTVDMFDKKPLMDIINYVRDLVGFLFFIDELGGVVWRMPNLFALGNYQSPQDYERRGRMGRTSEIVVIDEETTLLDYTTTLDSTNIRERIFVGNAVGGVGTVIKGFNPFPTHMFRTAGWTDQNFNTKRETRVMADMISAQQMFSYRRGQVTTPGYPKIQIDDQIRIFERVTNETYYHYVRGIKSELDMESGEWTYSLETHWLGEHPQDAWVVDVEELENATQQYLNAVGYEPSDAEDDPDAP